MNILPQCQHHKTNSGFTLVELLLVLALLGLVLAGIFQFFFFTNRTYADADGQSIVIQEANLFISQIEREIRSASKPNEATPAVRALNSGKQIDIYLYHPSASRYQRISYRLNPSDQTQLQKGWVSATASSTVPGTSANPQYGTIPTNPSQTGAWKTIVNNITPGQIFTDLTDSSSVENYSNYVTSERRLVKVVFNISDPKLNRPINMETSCMTRSGRSTASVLAKESPQISAASIVLTDKDNNVLPQTVTVPKNKNGEFLVVAKVYPLKATNRGIGWEKAKSDTWFSIKNGTTQSGNIQIIKIEADSTSTDRTANITVKSNDGKVTKTFSIKQPKK